MKFVAQTIGSKALGTPLTIEKLSINPRDGTIHLTDFKIANHETFGQSNAVSLASLDIAIDISSLFSSTVVVHRVEINSPFFIYEQSQVSDNISEFALSIQEFAGIDPSAPLPPPDLEKQEKARIKKEKKALKKASKPKKIMIVESLAINDVRLRFENTEDENLSFGAGFERFAVSMTNGTVRLDNLYVNNPGRLETENLFHLDEATIQLLPGSIYSSNIVINAVDVKNPHVFVERNAETDTIGEFLKIANGLIAKIPTNHPAAGATNELVATAAEETEPAAPPPNVALESFTLENLQLNVIDTEDPELNLTLGLEQVNVALERGDIQLDNLYISNPSRLRAPHLFLLTRLGVELAPGSHKEKTLIVENVAVEKPYVTLELTRDTDTVHELLKLANGFIARAPSYQLSPTPSAPPTESLVAAETAPAKPPVELRALRIDDIQLRLLDNSSTNPVSSTPRTLAGIESISMNLLTGKLKVNEITVPNLAGFTASNIFHLANIDVDIAPESINSEQVVINEIFINSPKVNLEQTEEGGNVAALQTALMKFAPEPSELPVFPSTAPPPAEEIVDLATTNTPMLIADQPVVLNQMLITNLAINLKFPVDTNQTAAARFGMDMGNLNPMDSILKLNPMGKDGAAIEEEKEMDPDAAMTVLAFDLLSLEPLKGLLYINNLRVSNPPSFSRRNLVQLEQFRIDLDPDTIQTDTLLIEDIVITKPRFRYERQIMTDNIKALQDEITQATTRRQTYMETTETTTNQVAVAEDSGVKQKVIIERVLLTDIVVRAKLSALPAIPTPPFKLEKRDIGKNEGGAGLADVGPMLFDFIYEGIVGAVGNATGLAGDTLKGAGALTFDAVGSLFGGVTDGVDSAVKKTEDAVKELNEKRKKRRGAGGRRSALK